MRFKSTPNVRKHLRLHFQAMAPSKRGGLLQNEKDQVVAWYEGLFKRNEESDKEEDKDSKSSNDENDKNDESYENNEEEVRVAMMRKAHIMKVARRMTGVDS